MSYASEQRNNGARPAPNGGRTGAAYRAQVALVRKRAKAGEPCCFCGGGFTWGVSHQDRWAFTAHHGARLMEGGSALVDSTEMWPAHRGCNSRDGLRAQNRRRRQQGQGGQTSTAPHTATHTQSNEPQSREW